MTTLADVHHAFYRKAKEKEGGASRRPPFLWLVDVMNPAMAEV
jgi:hypothetical protein